MRNSIAKMTKITKCRYLIDSNNIIEESLQIDQNYKLAVINDDLMEMKSISRHKFREIEDKYSINNCKIIDTCSHANYANLFELANIIQKVLFILSFIVEEKILYSKLNIEESYEKLASDNSWIEYRCNTITNIRVRYLSRNKVPKTLQITVVNNFEINGILSSILYELKINRVLDSLLKANSRNWKTELSDNIEILALPSVSASIIHEAVGHMAELDNFSLSDLQFKVGEVITSDEVTLKDIPNSDVGAINFRMDEEGNEAKEVEIINGGIFNSNYYDAYFATELNVISSGRCRSYGRQDIPVIRMGNLILENGKNNLLDIIKKIKNGIIATSVHNAEVDSQGTVSIWCRNAIWVKNGNVVGCIKLLELSENYRKIVSSINNLCSDGRWSNEIWCTKFEFRAPVGTFSPSFSCKMNFLNKNSFT